VTVATLNTSSPSVANAAASAPAAGRGAWPKARPYWSMRFFPLEPMRQWVLSFPYPLRFLFASRPAIMGQVLGIVYRVIAMHLIRKAGFTKKRAQTGAVTLIQRFGSALNLNIHLMCMDARMPRAHGCAGAAHMLFLDGIYIDGANGSSRFRWVKAPTCQDLTQLAHTIAQRVGRFLERQGLLERDVENSYLASDAVDEDPMTQLLGHSITYRIAIRKISESEDVAQQIGNHIEKITPKHSLINIFMLFSLIRFCFSTPR
jgi:hypothetical protein